MLFHVCVADRVFKEVADNEVSPPGVPGINIHPASAIDSMVVQNVQALLRRSIRRAFVGRGLLKCFDANEMPAYRHSGFSANTSLRIEGQERAGLEQLLRIARDPRLGWGDCTKRVPTLLTTCGAQSEPG